MNAVKMGVLAYNERALIPTDNYDWDTYQSRLFRYAYAESLYSNIAYRNITTFSQRMKADNDLYTHVRGIYNPVYRLVEAYVAKIYGGSLDFEDVSRGAIPITMASDELKEAIRQVWLWSNWRIQKSLYVRYGAQLGDVFLKVVDEPEKEKVRLEVVHPGKVKDATFDAVGNIKHIEIEYERCDDPGAKSPKWYTYGEMIDQESFSFTKDGRPYDYINEKEGGALAQYDNPYGFVPMTLTKHKDMGQMWGANAFHGQIGKIHELNDAASLLNDQIRKSVNLIWYFAGVTRKADIDAGKKADGTVADKDQVPAIYGPKESQPFPMVGNLDLTSAGVNIERLIAELERDTPELAMHRLREAGNPTAPGIKAGYSDAIDRFSESQGVYDDGLIRAQKMAVSIGGMRRYEGFEAFNLESYDKGDLEHNINARPIVADELSKVEKINALKSAQVPAFLILRELDYDEDTIKEVEAYNEQQQQKQQQVMLEAKNGNNDPNAKPGDKGGQQQGQNGKPAQTGGFDMNRLREIHARVGIGAVAQPA